MWDNELVISWLGLGSTTFHWAVPNNSETEIDVLYAGN